MELIALALSPQGAAWCPDGCGTLLRETLRASTAALSASFGTDPAKWRWGNAHQAVFAPPLLGQVPVIGPLLSARIAQPGDDATVFRGGLREGTFDSVHGPGFRGVYDLADLDRSLFAATPGQSGNPFSTHAADLMRRWQEGSGITIGAVPATIAGRLRLEP
jgi:penicillin amidase